MSSKMKARLIIGSISFLVVSYLMGLLTQFIHPELRQKVTADAWAVPERSPVGFGPIKCLSYAWTTTEGLIAIGICAALVGIVFMYMYLGKDGLDREDERGFTRSLKGTYGTAGWMLDSEIKRVLDWKSIRETDGMILGIKNDKIVSLPSETFFNKHIAIFGSSGSMKSRTFARNQIFQCALRGESQILTDPKGELYADTSEYLRRKGYDVKVFNLVNPQYSDAWNCLAEINSSGPENIELMAQTFVEVIIKNTSDENSEEFWEKAEGNLLKALALYTVCNEFTTDEEKTIGKMYEMLTNNDEKKLNAMFDRLPQGHPAKQPYSIFQKSGDTVKANTIIGLGARLNVFQSKMIRDITAHSEIDMEAPGRRKCAYFIIMSDQESTLNFLSSLFFSFLFIRLVKYADVHGKGGKLDVPVNFILDEFPNIGQIPDFTKKLSTIRSRDLRVAVIFQNIAQLENRYPRGLWEEILGNCDTHLFLGCSDQTTAKFISDRTGEMTIDVNSTSMQKQSIAIEQNIPQYKETASVGKRLLMTKDEVMRMEKMEALVIVRGQKVLKVNKFDYTNHPESKLLVPSYVREHIPAWRMEEDRKALERENERYAEDDDTAPTSRRPRSDRNDDGMDNPRPAPPPAQNRRTDRSGASKRRVITQLNLIQEDAPAKPEPVMETPKAHRTVAFESFENIAPSAAPEKAPEPVREVRKPAATLYEPEPARKAPSLFEQSAAPVAEEKSPENAGPKLLNLGKDTCGVTGMFAAMDNKGKGKDVPIKGKISEVIPPSEAKRQEQEKLEDAKKVPAYVEKPAPAVVPVSAQQSKPKKSNYSEMPDGF